MGDGANIFFADSRAENGSFTGLYLYTHWGGESLPEVVQSGLKRGKRRWGDSYLARILFCELIKDDVLGETGFGLSTVMGDPGVHPIIRVDNTASRVSFHTDGDETDPNDTGTYSWTYEEFVSASLDSLQEKYAEGGE